MDELLEELERPALVLWGMKDPWMIPRRAEEILECYPRADRVNLMSGGHCPHDDCPEEFNRELSRWAASVIKAPTAAPLS